ncbi:MAG: hypothetical protein ACE5EA_07700 [Nitrospirota bacterium]
MTKNRKKQVYKTMREFEEKFFPNAFKKRLLKEITDPRILGITLAQKSLNKIKHKLSKQLNLT